MPPFTDTSDPAPTVVGTQYPNTNTLSALGDDGRPLEIGAVEKPLLEDSKVDPDETKKTLNNVKDKNSASWSTTPSNVNTKDGGKGTLGSRVTNNGRRGHSRSVSILNVTKSRAVKIVQSEK